MPNRDGLVGPAGAEAALRSARVLVVTAYAAS